MSMDERFSDLDSKFESMVYQYLLEEGKIIPVSDEEIEYTTKHLQPVPVPEELKNSSFILNNLNKKINYESSENDYNTFMAMAAREGQERLPDEILQQMLNDRKKTENDCK